MTEIKAEYKIEKVGNSIEKKYFPLKVADAELFLQFVAKFIRFPLSHGVNQIVIHSDGQGNIMKTDEMKVNK